VIGIEMKEVDWPNPVGRRLKAVRPKPDHRASANTCHRSPRYPSLDTGSAGVGINQKKGAILSHHTSQQDSRSSLCNSYLYDSLVFGGNRSEKFPLILCVLSHRRP
jgi:hypothetical protein